MQAFTGLSMAVLMATGANTVPAGSPDLCDNRPGCVCERHEAEKNVPACHRQAPDPNDGKRDCHKGCCCLSSAPFEAPSEFEPPAAGRTCVRHLCVAAHCGPLSALTNGPLAMATAPPALNRRATSTPLHIPLRC